jgi:hypothetical protein
MFMEAMSWMVVEETPEDEGVREEEVPEVAC